nr:PHP domain-containing protein [Candidatus Sigynarchaeota archaeon]
MKRFDLHVHTEATSPYMQGDAQLETYHDHGAQRQLDFMGISDHYHYFWQDTRFVQAQRAHLNAHAYVNPRLFLGVEQTILSKNGRIGIRNSGRKVLDYMILAIHWMPVGGRLSYNVMVKILKSQGKTAKLLEIAKQFYRNAVLNPKLSRLPKIIGHPFNFVVGGHESVPAVHDAIDWLCKFISEEHVAFEINRDSIPRNPAIIDAHVDKYWKLLSDAVNSYHVMLTLGTDAHHLDAIGCIDPMLDFVEKYKIDKTLLVDESFFSKI